MDTLKYLFLMTLCGLIAVSCSVISKDIRSQAEPRIPFKEISRNPLKYQGRTVVIGGYVLENTASETQTTLTILQSPLKFEDEPDFKDNSEGRFKVSHQGYLDPEVYAKDRKITVGGTIAGCDKAASCHKPYPLIESNEIYLWPKYDPDYRYRYYRFPYRGFYHHRFHYFRHHYYYW